VFEQTNPIAAALEDDAVGVAEAIARTGVLLARSPWVPRLSESSQRIYKVESAEMAELNQFPPVAPPAPGIEAA
jgi:hypothetical protein